MPTPFEIAYRSLNPEQKKAVDTIDGPVMVIAGPGTGKTRVLTIRIANILQKTDANPHNILALTFTEAATSTMKKRLIDLIGTTGYSVRIQTFHGFCQEVISSYPEYFPFGTNTIPASEVQTHSIMEKLLDDPTLVALRTPGSKYHYLRKILSAINTLKSEGIPPAKFRDLVKSERDMFEQEKESLSKTARVKKESEIAKQEELLKLYISYQQELRAQSLIDFTDMIVHTVEALRKSETLRTLLQENLQYILVDEYQDTNGAQNTVVDLLASFWGTAANVFVVGDPHQTIFRFQGASFENTIGFLTRYPASRVITLATGYRAPQTIYTAAHALISHNTSSQALLTALATANENVATLVTGISQALQGKSDVAEPTLTLATLQTAEHERTWVATQIQKKIDSGVSPQEIAILVKTNDQATALAQTLAQYDIAHHVDRTTDALTSELGLSVLSLLQTLATLHTNTESPHLYHTLAAPWMGLSPVALMKLTRSFSKQKSIHAFAEYIESQNTTDQDHARIQERLQKLMELSQLSQTFALPNWIALVFEEIGLVRWINSQAQIADNLAILTAFHSFATANYVTDPTLTMQQYMALLDTMREQGLSLSVQSTNETHENVTIATIHKAKGREWDFVYIPHLRDGIWGGGKARSGITLPEGIIATQAEDDQLEDDRRLFYVALTRAKQQAILTYPASVTDSGKVSETLPSQFLAEVPTGLITPVDTSGYDQIQSTLHTLSPIRAEPFGEYERAWIRSIIEEMSLSVSALNTYLRDPKEFLMRHILSIPEPVEPHLAFGNAIHTALESHYKTYRSANNTHPADSFTIAVFEDTLKKEILSPNDFESRRSQGIRVLQDYLAQKKSQFPEILATEEGFGWKRGPILLGDIRLSGKIDRLDIQNASSHVLNIIDYKTGKQKSTNQIEGKVGLTEMSERERALPESIRGSMKRQLLFYKLLLSRDPLYKLWTIGTATFEFVESDKGKLVERTFELPNTDVKMLEDLITEVMTEIRSLQFLEALE